MSVPIKMKLTKEKLQQIIKEEYQRALNEMDDLEQDMYPGADERGDPDNWDRPDPYRVDALAAVDQLKELISDVDTDILEYEDILAAVQALRNKLEYYMS
jgi:hypothetical protein